MTIINLKIKKKFNQNKSLNTNIFGKKNWRIKYEVNNSFTELIFYILCLSLSEQTYVLTNENERHSQVCHFSRMCLH